MIQRGNSNFDLEERFTRDRNRLGEKDLDRIAKAYRELLHGVGEDLDREGLRRTPDRAARALEFLTQGYRQDLDEIINDAVFESDASEIILVKDIELYSLCEHHRLPFIGRAYVVRIAVIAGRLTVGRSPRRKPLNSSAVSRRRPTIKDAPNGKQAPRILGVSPFARCSLERC